MREWHILWSMAFVLLGTSSSVEVLSPQIMWENFVSAFHSMQNMSSLISITSKNVAVYGQGLIGLLVATILGLQNQMLTSKSFGITTVFYAISDRLSAGARLGASQALLPGGSEGPFDVSIEVSGNWRALQSAIDHTSNGGRIIIGS